MARRSWMSILSEYEFIDDDERLRRITAERARVRRVVHKFLASRKPLEFRPRATAIVYLHERIHADSATLNPLPAEIDALVLNAPKAARRLILLAVLQGLSESPWEASPWEMNISKLRFLHDYHWGKLIEALLRTKLDVDDDLVVSILQRLSALADRFDSNFPMNNYPFPFAALIRFIDKRIAACSHAAVAPSIQKLLKSIQKAVERDLVKLKGYRRTEAKSLAANPGRWFVKADRAAIERIEGWATR